MAVNTFRNIHRLFPSAMIPASSDPLTLPTASEPLELEIFESRGERFTLDDFFDGVS